MQEQHCWDSCRMRGRGAVWEEHWNMEFKCQYGILKWENVGVGFRKVVSQRNKKTPLYWESGSAQTVSCQPGKLRKQGRENQRLWTLEGMKENSGKYQGGTSRSRAALKPLAGRKQQPWKQCLLQEQCDESLEPWAVSLDTKHQQQGHPKDLGMLVTTTTVPFTLLCLDATATAAHYHHHH